MAHTVFRLLVAIALAGSVIAAYEPTPDRRAIAEAIAIGQSRIEAQRTRFHQAYRVPVGQAPVDYLEIVTPFRRVVLAVEAGARAGNRIFGQQDAIAALSNGNQIDVIVELTFHPLNTLITMPSHNVFLSGAGAPSIQPRDFEQSPRYSARVDGLPPGVSPLAPGSQPMLGGTLIARFDGGLLRPNGLYDAVVSEAGKELARARIDLGKLR